VNAQSNNSTQLFDDNWLFYRGAAQGAEDSAFADAKWKKINLPHDWSIEDIPGTNSPFSIDAVSQVNGGFTAGGVGWYRKSFTVPASQKDKKLFIQFDGVYMNAEVYLNGKRLGKHPYGYTSFWYNVTERIRFGTNNVLAVKVSNVGENSRWYSGSGIYRHVWLTTVAPIHVTPWGVSVTSEKVSAASAIVKAKTTIGNEEKQAAEITLVTRVFSTKGLEVAKAESKQVIQPKESYTFDQEGLVKSPGLWSVEEPTLYTAVAEVYGNGLLINKTETKFGIRSIAFSAINGFQLNGKSLKLKGGCVHHDNGPLGAKAYDRAEERKVEILKANGYNAIRCAHNPPSPAFLDACDRLGMLVIDEAFDMWEDGKNPFDYHLYFKDWWQRDLQSMVLRDRNHPSIIMWSIGNEIPNRDKPEVAAVAKTLADYVRSIDSTRPVTCGVNGIEENKDAFLSALDVAGYNYARINYEPDHKRLPERIMFATESLPLEAFDYWMGVIDHPWVIGDFVWTSFDYIGEASLGWRGYKQYQNFFPWNLAFCGDIDICGWKRPQSYYRDALWKKNQLSLFVKPPTPSYEFNTNKVSWSHWEWHDVVASWNWEGNENKPLEVEVYSSCPEVELFLNGKSLGRKRSDRSTKFTATFQVPYQPGELKAIGYDDKKQVAAAELNTAAKPARLIISADRTTIKADGQDLSYVTVEIADAKGNRHPKADNLLQFEIEGNGSIEAVGNANPTSIESNQQPKRQLWQGRCLVIVKSGKTAGPITLRAKGDGIEPVSLVIQSR
ncbi:MAG TPA: glycoside hydrolase family 2 TIM barrel-domain containing protein, partial [Segetibacter sp.]|nr:glycoside hydrolase family 2 TIM barrel-domain containing protein [Segetibacter sp.]